MNSSISSVQSHLTNGDTVTGEHEAATVCEQMTRACLHGTVYCSRIFVQFFPTPMAYDATLRLLGDKVSKIFSSVLPYDVVMWTGARFFSIIDLLAISVIFGATPEHLRERRAQLQGIFLSKLLAQIAWLAHSILLFSGTPLTLLAQSESLVGRLSFWKDILMNIRNVCFGFSSITLIDTHPNFVTVVREAITTIGMLMSWGAGYTPAVGILATIAASIGLLQHFYPDWDIQLANN
jgi:hypothetical protein